jgi:hypothetical protein
MKFQAARRDAISNDRATRDVGTTEQVSELRLKWLEPAALAMSRVASAALAADVLRAVTQADTHLAAYGGGDTDPEAVFNALQVGQAFIDEVSASDVGWEPPHIGTNEEGAVAFEWWEDERKLTIYIGPSDARFVSSWGPNIETEMVAGTLRPGGFSQQWTWLKGRGEA